MTIELSVDERLKIVDENTWFAQQRKRIKEWPTFNEGHGIYLRDTEGKEYIDGTSGSFCTGLGHGNKKVIKAIEEQLEMVQFARAARSDVTLPIAAKNC